MSYFAQSDLTGLVPSAWVTEALDDDANGSGESFTSVQTVAEDEVNAMLGMRYTTPRDTTGNAGLASFLRSLCATIAAETLYGRRGAMDRFPFAERLKTLRAQLKAIADGRQPLSPRVEPDSSSLGATIGVISAPARSHSDSLSV